MCDDIEHGLEKLTDPDDIERRQLIRSRLQALDLEVEYGRVLEANAVRAKITELLQDTEYNSMTDNIVSFFTENNKESAKKLYTGTLHEFGLRDGVAIYRLLKDVV